MIKRECGNCEFYEQEDYDGGKCYRFPPVYVGNIFWDVPTVNYESFCGEFKQEHINAAVSAPP